MLATKSAFTHIDMCAYACSSLTRYSASRVSHAAAAADAVGALLLFFFENALPQSEFHPVRIYKRRDRRAQFVYGILK